MILLHHAKHITNNVEGFSCARMHPVAFITFRNFLYIFHIFAFKFLRGFTLLRKQKMYGKWNSGWTPLNPSNLLALAKDKTEVRWLCELCLVKGTQSALGPRWPGHYFSDFEKCSPQPEIKVLRFNPHSVLLDFQWFTEKAWKACFWVCFCSSCNVVFIIFR